MSEHKVFGFEFAVIYPLYLAKVQRKGQRAEDVDEVIRWLTGYDQDELIQAIADKVTLREFFENAPKLNPNASLITGLICGIRVENIDDPLMQNIRYMDKLVDEVARGKRMTSIFRAQADA